MATERLPMRTIRNILRLKWSLQRSHRETARSLGISAGAVGLVVTPATQLGLGWSTVEGRGEDELDEILCHQEGRVVGQDNTVTLDQVVLQIRKQPGRRTCAGLEVVVRRHLDGRCAIWRGPQRLGLFDALGQPVDAAAPVDDCQRPPTRRRLRRRRPPLGPPRPPALMTAP